MTTESRWRKLFHPHTSARVDPVIFYIKISGNVASIGRIPIPPFSTELNSTYRTHFNITCIINLTGSYSKFQLLSPPYSRQISKLSSKRRKEKGKEKSLFLSFFLSFLFFLPPLCHLYSDGSWPSCQLDKFSKFDFSEERKKGKENVRNSFLSYFFRIASTNCTRKRERRGLEIGKSKREEEISVRAKQAGFGYWEIT